MNQKEQSPVLSIPLKGILTKCNEERPLLRQLT